MNKNTKIKIRNRSAGSVGYVIPDTNGYHRKFEAGEVKELPFSEIQSLAFMPGGDYILQHYLVIDNIEARDEILGNVEIEYNYTKEDIEKLLKHGSMDQFLDCLDFAPAGVIDLIKQMAVSMKLNDINKRKAIKDKFGFSVDNAVAANEETEDHAEVVAPTRRVSVSNEAPEAPARRYNTIK